ncbi:MAG TPA: transglycosylase SLT domain-containing protein [Xanthomonadaceae bacterium]|nr:transglycosylase SLT domain-containing protein [Xanthomonadaceae bacterium]
MHRAVLPRLAPLACVLSALLVAMPEASASRRDEAAVAAINQQMAAAESRYRRALVKIANNAPDGQKDSDAALEDMEDAVAACGSQRGCQVSTLLATYKRLLKDAADGGAADADDGDDIDPADPDPDHNDAGHAGAIAFNASVPQAAHAASLLSGQGHDFDAMVQYNPAVQAGIRRWLTDMRGALLSSYENYETMRQLMWPSYQRAGLPEALLFGIMAKESNGKVHATSRTGAAGPLQFMYATGRRFGLGPDATGFDTRYDPRAAAEASAAYLNERMGELNHSVELALAAYNGGEGRALRVYQGSGGRSFWDADVYAQFPEETRDYVPMVVAAAWLFLHPRQYGLTFPKVDARPAPLQLQQPASIYELAICLGNKGMRDGYLRPLRNLNPRYDADSWLPAGTTLNATTRIVGLYDRYCTQGPRAALAAQLVRANPATAIVRVGELQPVPMGAATTPATTVQSAAVQTPPAADPPRAIAAARPQPKTRRTPGHYRVQRGETLTAIADRFQCDLRALARDNALKGPRYAIRPGQRLKLATCGD